MARDYINLDITEMCKDILSDTNKAHYAYMETFRRHVWEVENIQTDKVRFSNKKALPYLAIIEMFKHYKGSLAGTHLVLEDWQLAIFGIMTGWEVQEDEGIWVRRFRDATMFVARKNGKSILASAFALAIDIIDGEKQNDIYFASTKRDQSKIRWLGAHHLIQSCPPDIRSMYKKTINRITKKDGGVMEYLGRDSNTLDGLNANVLVMDEYAANPTSEVYDVIKSSMGSRRQPISIVITTANYFLACPFVTMLDNGKEVMKNYKDLRDIGFRSFYFLCYPDEGVDPYSDEALAMANPNAGVSVSWSFLREAAKTAKQYAEKRPEFFIKHVNIFQATSTIFLKEESIKKAMVPKEQFKAIDKTQALRKIVGLDLSISDDFTAIADVYVMENGRQSQTGTLSNKLYVDIQTYIPEDGIKERSKKLRAPLQAWADKGHLNLVKGGIINMDYIYSIIKDKIEGAASVGMPITLAYDPYASQHIVSRLDAELNFNKLGEEVFKVSQGYTLSESNVAIRNGLDLGDIVILDNPVVRWMFSNVEMQEDDYGRVKFVKKSDDASKKIDAFAALACAVKYSLFKQDDDDYGSSPIYFG